MAIDFTLFNMLGISKIYRKFSNNPPKGFMVRLCYKNRKPMINKEFLESDYGSELATFFAVLRYRDRKLKELELKKLYPVSHRRCKATARSKSKVVGVHRSYVWAGASKGRPKRRLNCYRWVASWYENGKLKTAQFGETKWGAENAFEMACLCRNECRNVFREKKITNLNQLYDSNLIHFTKP